MKFSYCIPMTCYHLSFLKGALESIFKFNLKPDEIVVSVSDVISEDLNNLLRSYEQQLSNFIETKFILSRDRKLAGANRNSCIDSSKNDLLIFSDVDDRSHPNRTKIINEIFNESENVIHLTHAYSRVSIGESENFKSIENIPKIEKFSIDEVRKNKTYSLSDRVIHNGAVSFLKSRIGDTRYVTRKEDYVVFEDQDFNIDILNKINQSYFLNLDLYNYVIGQNNLAGIT